MANVAAMFDAIAAPSGWVSYAKCLRENVHR